MEPNSFNRPLHILTVDDDPDDIEILRNELRYEGFVNCKFFTETEAIVQSLTADVQMCVLDHKLGGIYTGFDIMLKAKAVNPDCFFFIISQMKDPELIIKYMNNGANYWVTKKSNYVKELIGYMKQVLPKIKARFELVDMIEKQGVKYDERLKSMITK